MGNNVNFVIARQNCMIYICFRIIMYEIKYMCHKHSYNHSNLIKKIDN